MKTRPDFFEKPDLMMNLVVETGLGSGACGNGWGAGVGRLGPDQLVPDGT